MSSLAEIALEHARQRLAGESKKPNPILAKPAAPAPAAAKQPENLVVPTGPINRFMFLEGRAWAIDMVTTLRAAKVEVVIERLTGAALGRPGSYAAGIQSVVSELQGAESAGGSA